jgi:hypothetical protein
MSPALSQADAGHAVAFASDMVREGAANTVLVQNKRTEATGKKSLPAEIRTPGAPVVVGKDTIFFV